jgi:hypothetical protein
MYATEQETSPHGTERKSGSVKSIRTVQYSTVQHSTVQYSTVQYSTVQCSTVQYSTAQYSTVQYSTVQYSTVQYSTVQYSTVQYSTVHLIAIQNSISILTLFCIYLLFTDLGTLEVEVEDFFGLMLRWLQCNIEYHIHSDTQYCRMLRLLEASLMTTFSSI